MATGYRRLNNGYGATLVKDAVAHFQAGQRALNQAKGIAGAVVARAVAEMELAEFGAQTGEGQAVHDEIGTLSDNADTFMSTNKTLFDRYNPGG